MDRYRNVIYGLGKGYQGIKEGQYLWNVKMQMFNDIG
jgi:hypothetical protein